jgi:hypothetical protein
MNKCVLKWYFFFFFCVQITADMKQSNQSLNNMKEWSQSTRQHNKRARERTVARQNFNFFLKFEKLGMPCKLYADKDSNDDDDNLSMYRIVCV